MSKTNPTLESLGATVAELSKVLSTQLRAANHAEPSFAADGPVALPPTPEIQGPRLMLVEALMDLLHLATGPGEYVLQQSFVLNHDPFVFDALNQFDFYGAVPLDGSASYAEIAKWVKLPEQIVRRILRYAMASHLFAEEGGVPGADRIVHTSTTAYCVRVPIVRSLIGHCMEDAKPAAAHGVEALHKFFEGTETPTEERDHCAWPLAWGGLTCWEFLDQDEAPGKPRGYRARRFAEAMQAITQTSAVGVDVALEQYDWNALGDATVVDLGGSAGHISVLLAERHPRLKLIVQDLPAAESAFRANVTGDMAKRITFQTHDFFTPQGVAADAYLIKSVLHDWSDKYVVEILRNLLPAIRPGTRVIIFDIIVPPDSDPKTGGPAAPRPVRRTVAAIDLQMHVLLNSKERKVEDWVAVVKRADPRFELRGVHVLPGAPFGILEITLQG